MTRKATIIFAAAGALGIVAATSGLARADSALGAHRSWWDQVEKAQECAMGGGNPYVYALQSPCISTPPAAYADARRAYPGYYGYPAYGYGYAAPYLGYGHGTAYPPYRYGWGYGY